jgi:hypothetical protein
MSAALAPEISAHPRLQLVRKITPISSGYERGFDGRNWPISEMAVAQVGGRLLGWSCRHCGIRATRGHAPGAPGSGRRTDGLRTSPVGEGPGWSVPAIYDGRRGGVGRDPGARVAAAAWPQGEPALGIAFDDIGTPTLTGSQT